MFLLGKNGFSLHDVIDGKEILIKKEENKENLEQSIIEAFNELVILIKKYLKDNKKTVYDLISISKNPTFDKEITNSLKD